MPQAICQNILFCACAFASFCSVFPFQKASFCWGSSESLPISFKLFSFHYFKISCSVFFYLFFFFCDLAWICRWRRLIYDECLMCIIGTYVYMLLSFFSVDQRILSESIWIYSHKMSCTFYTMMCIQIYKSLIINLRLW